MQDKNIPFCSAPWVSIQYGALLNSGGVTPCCEWQGNSFKGSLNEYSDSNYLNRIKTAMINHDYSFINESCESCISLEKLNITSTRQHLYNRQLNIDDGLRIIDYRPSNLCNLKCRMCFAENSSLIAKEENKKIIEYDTTDIYSMDFTNLIQLNVLGGEPTISDELIDLLNFLVKNNLSKNIDLMFTTNATNTNSKWMDLISKFNRCYVIISLDGTGKVYEYVRTNANWSSVLKNVNVYEQSGLEMITFQITASMYNMPVVEEWIEWFFNKTNVNIYPVEGRLELTLAALPDDIRQEKIDYLKKFDSKIAKDAIMIMSSTKFDKSLNDKFKNYTYAKDKIRNTNILELSPVYERVLNT
jgi:sulfatase maturation enzyme AslB (radical SAM superfamily)